jgi:DNA-binding MarR family transcriptional regulator
VDPGIQYEIKQTKPFDSIEQEAFLALQRTADQLQGKVAEWLKSWALSPTQYNALRILRGAGEDGLACSEIADRMINRDPDITRLLDRLEKRGLTRRSRDSTDRRVINAYITKEGLQLLKKLDAPIQEFQQVLLGHVGQRKLRTLIEILCATRNG